MLLYTVLCVYFLAPKIETNGHPSSEEKPEPIFVDVIKNITRVNKELKVLIQKYKQIKKKRYFQDDFKDVMTTPSENNATTSLYPTEMIFMEEEEKASGSERSNEENHGLAESSSETEKSQEAESQKLKENEINLREIARLQADEKDLENITKDQNKTELNPKLSNKALTDVITSEEKPKLSIHLNHFDEKPNDVIVAENFNKEPKLPIDMSHSKKEKRDLIDEKNSKEETKDENKSFILKVLEEKVAPVSKKTRYSVKGTLIKESDKRSTQPSKDRISVVLEDEEKVDESKNMESIEATTIKFTAGIYLRTINESNSTKKLDNETSEVLNDDDDLSRELIETNALRQAYEEACLKVVVRKCYKACKAVLKSSCRTGNCKNELKNFFEKKSRTRCIAEFDNNSNKKKDLRRIDTTAPTNSTITMTRDDLTPACLMPARFNPPTQETLTNNTQIHNGTEAKNGTKIEKLNILRDKYERACQKVSRKKCNQACIGTGDDTCNKYECKKKLKKSFRRNCKTECGNAYPKSKSSGSDSDSDKSDSESDSKSDDDSKGDSKDDSDDDDEDDDDEDEDDDKS